MTTSHPTSAGGRTPSDGARSATIPRATLRRLARELLVAHGADRAEADTVAGVLTWCDAAGRANQGVWRLPLLCKRLERGVLVSPCAMTTERRAPSLLSIDGGAGMGHYVAERAMSACLDVARTQGVAAAAVRNSNFVGAVAYYVNQAAGAGCIGLAFSNSFPKVAAHGGARPVLGTNPLAVAAPRRDGTSFLLDMATSAAAGSTITRAAERKEPLDEGVAVDASGAPTRDPAAARGGALLPAAGAKGYGLALTVEILAGVLSGAGISSGVRSMYSDFTGSGDNGHLFVAIEIASLMPIDQFYDRLEVLAGLVADSGDPAEPPALPGEARWQWLRQSASAGVGLDAATVAMLHDLGAARGVDTSELESAGDAS